MLQVLMQFVIQSVGQDLAVFYILYVLLPFEKTVGGLVLPQVLHGADDMVHSSWPGANFVFARFTFCV